MNNIVVIYGEEKFLIEKEIKKIIKFFKIEINNNIIKYDMEFSSLDSVLNEVSIMSLFSDKKVVIVNNCSFLTGLNQIKVNEKSIENLEKYIDNPNDNSVLIFIVKNSKLDSRKKIVKKMKNNCTLIEVPKMDKGDMIKISRSIFEKNNYIISENVLKNIVFKCGNNFSNLYNEIKKLMIYKIEDKKIDNNDLDLLLIEKSSDDIFSLVDFVVEKKYDKIFKVYSKIDEEPIKVIAILANQFRLIFQVKEFNAKKMTDKEIASNLKVHPYRVKLAREKGFKYSKKTLLKYLQDLEDLDFKIKSGKINKNIGLELFFLQL